MPPSENENSSDDSYAEEALALVEVLSARDRKVDELLLRAEAAQKAGLTPGWMMHLPAGVGVVGRQNLVRKELAWLRRGDGMVAWGEVTRFEARGSSRIDDAGAWCFWLPWCCWWPSAWEISSSMGNR